MHLLNSSCSEDKYIHETYFSHVTYFSRQFSNPKIVEINEVFVQSVPTIRKRSPSSQTRNACFSINRKMFNSCTQKLSSYLGKLLLFKALITNLTSGAVALVRTRRDSLLAVHPATVHASILKKISHRIKINKSYPVCRIFTTILIAFYYDLEFNSSRRQIVLGGAQFR